MYTVRPARREDSETLLRLIDALADYEKLERPDADARARLVLHGWEQTPPRFWAFLSIDDATGRAVGYAIVLETYSSFLAKPTLYIEDLFVLPEARGTGAGSGLFRFLCAETLRRDCGRMEWVCLDWNELAIQFYEKRGAYHLHDWRYYRLSGDALAEQAAGGESNQPR